MAEYIDRKSAIDVVTKWFDKIHQNGDICIDGLRSLPAADVVERKTERWIFSYDHGGPNSAYFCSNCRRTIHTADLDAWSFCPSCGAEMEREGKGCTKRL